MLDEHGLDEPQSPSVVLHTAVQLDRFQGGWRGEVDGQPRGLQLRVVDRAFDRPAQETADDVTADRRAPSTAGDFGWHVMIYVAQKIWHRRRWIDVIRHDLRFGQYVPPHERTFLGNPRWQDSNSRHYSFVFQSHLPGRCVARPTVRRSRRPPNGRSGRWSPTQDNHRRDCGAPPGPAALRPAAPTPPR